MNLQGLHCHHPRNCLFYLRDCSIPKLQNVLIFGAVSFMRDSPLPAVQSPSSKSDIFLMKKWLRRKSKAVVSVCNVVESKEMGQSLKVWNYPPDLLTASTQGGLSTNWHAHFRTIITYDLILLFLKDEPCGRPVEVKAAGLCELHYKVCICDL